MVLLSDTWSDLWTNQWGVVRPPGIIPIRELTTGDILYGDRTTTYRWEVLRHQPDGTDTLLGVLDGVVSESARLSWSNSAQVKGSGDLRVADLDQAAPGMLRIGDLELESVRIRPVCVIDGLPEIPLSVYLVSAAPEEWSDTGRVWAVELHDRTTVPAQDKTASTFAVAKGTPILPVVQAILASCGEQITVDTAVTVATSADMVWETGTSKLTIINDLLDAAGYTGLWVDGWGLLQATKYVLPAQRGTTYEILGLPRELVDGERSIYAPDWTRDRDQFDIPNRVVAVSSGTSEEAGLVGVYDNTDPESPFSYPSRGRWIVETITGVEVPDGTDVDKVAALVAKARRELISLSSSKATVTVKALPLPVRVSDVLRFVSRPAGIDARHVITRMELDAHPLGLCSYELTEVTDL